ncbi:MAG: sensor histidine kinase [Chitinophagales bacterium]
MKEEIKEQPIKNRLLKRQIKRAFGHIENVPSNVWPLLEAVDKSYSHFTEDRELLERAMDISSEELYEANAKLRAETAKQQQIFQKLKQSLSTLLSLDIGLKETIDTENDENLLHLAELIEKQAHKIKAVEEELLLIKKLINQSTDSVQVANEDGQFIFVNEETARRTNYTIEEMLQLKVRDIEQIFAEEGSWEKHLEELKGLPEGMIIEGVNRRLNGETFPVEVNTRYVKIDDKAYLLAFSRDISERKKAELLQQALINDLESANTELKDFAYVVSHDLKAPLRGIGSLTDWLIQDYADLLDEDGKMHLKLLKKRVNRMHNLIEGILQYSRIGRIDDFVTNVDLNLLLLDVLDSLSKPENFDVQIEGHFPIVQNDETRMRQVFQNLISNAIKYNDKKIGQVVIKCINEPTRWVFSVTDNGPGIDKKYYEKVFQIFQTLNARDRVESTGIGLTLVKRIVENNKGKIWIEATEKEGTCFCFTLPK